MSLRILLVDDHEVVRAGLKTLLTDMNGCKVCGEATNAQEAVEKTLQLKPDLVLLDVSMPIMNGLKAARVIRQVAPTTKIVILSMHDSAQIAKEATLAGAHTYLTKACAPDEPRAVIVGVCKDSKVEG